MRWIWFDKSGQMFLTCWFDKQRPTFLQIKPHRRSPASQVPHSAPFSNTETLLTIAAKIFQIKKKNILFQSVGPLFTSITHSVLVPAQERLVVSQPTLWAYVSSSMTAATLVSEKLREQTPHFWVATYTGTIKKNELFNAASVCRSSVFLFVHILL